MTAIGEYDLKQPRESTLYLKTGKNEHFSSDCESVGLRTLNTVARIVIPLFQVL